MGVAFGFLRELRLGELRQLVRGLGRARVFALTAILTLAFGVGANVVVFGVMDALLLRPMAGVSKPGELRFIQRRTGPVQSFPQYLDLRARNHSFSNMGAYDVVPVGLSVHGKAEQRWANVATGSYFDLLGVKPYLGRFLTDSDDRRGTNGSPYAVLSYATWKRDFDSDRGIAGRTVMISKHPFTVLGVAPPSFVGTERFMAPALWVDIWNVQQVIGFDLVHDRSAGAIWVIGRRKPGVTNAQMLADLNGLAHQMARENPKTDDGIWFSLTRPGLIGDYLGKPVREFLAALMVLAALVLAAACANLGGLYAARAADRSRELALRMALGASRAQVVGNVMLESLLLSLTGGALGCGLGSAALRALTSYRLPFDLPIAVAVDPGLAVYGFALLLALAAGLLCGLVPAREALRAAPYLAMKAGAAEATGRKLTLRDALLLLEVTLCCVLVTAAFVSLRGLERARHAPLGFQPAGVTLVTYNLISGGYSGDAALHFSQRLADDVARVPGVAGTAFASATPLAVGGADSRDIYPAATTDFRPRSIVFDAPMYDVSPGYLRTAGTSLLAGRDFTAADNGKAPQVAIVNETFARRLFGKKPAVGQSFLAGQGERITVVGVAQDGKYTSLNEEPTPAFFRPEAQAPSGYTQLVVRIAPGAMADQARITSAVTGIVRRQDPSVPISDVATWQQALAPVLFPARAASVALGVLGALALLLAVTGIFGLASYAVSRRMREFGIRVALGAARGDVLGAAVGRVAKILLAGSVAGIGLGVLSSRVLASVVYGATASDPVVLLVTALTMAAVGCAAAALPARRALGVDPAMLLREE